MEKFDAHGYKRRFELVIRGIKKSDLPDTTKRLLIDFSDYCIAEGLAIPTTVKHLFCLQNVARWAKKSLKKADKKEIIRIIGVLEKSHYSAEVKHATKVSMKKFYKWLNGGEEYPENVRWIKSSQKSKVKLPEELLTKEDVEKMINAAEYTRDKAIISILYESGCRAGELLSMRINSVEFDKLGVKIMLNGKTGMRRVRLVASVGYLATLFENHPFRDNPRAPFWIGLSTSNKNQQIDYSDVGRLIRKLAKKAGIKKRVHAHLFRHSRATFLANHLTEAQMNQYFGWVQGSDMPSVYVHLSGKDVDGPILQLHGLDNEEKKEKDEFTLKKCYRCEKMNPPTGKFCLKCGALLDIKTAIGVEKKRNKVDDFMTSMVRDLLKDPEIRNIIIKKAKKMNFAV